MYVFEFMIHLSCNFKPLLRPLGRAIFMECGVCDTQESDKTDGDGEHQAGARDTLFVKVLTQLLAALDSWTRTMPFGGTPYLLRLQGSAAPDIVCDSIGGPQQARRAQLCPCCRPWDSTLLPISAASFELAS